MCRSSTSERTVKGKLKNMSFLDANSSTLTKNIVIINNKPSIPDKITAVLAFVAKIMIKK